MTDIELLKLKKQLQATLLKDVKHMIEVKNFNATCSGVVSGVSQHGNDSVFVDVLVDRPDIDTPIVKITIHFKNNLNELFEQSGWPAFGEAVPTNLSPLDIARCRILRAVFLAIKNLNQRQFDFMLGKYNNWIEALYEGHWGVANYIRGK